MKKAIHSILTAAAACAVLVFLSVSTNAQSIWVNPTDHETHVSVEWARSEFNNFSELSFFTSAVYISGRYEVTDGVRVVGEVPFSFYDASFDNSPENTRDNAIGNPYLGIEVAARNSPTWGELGVRIPITPSSDNEAVFTGFYADYDRCEAFMPDILSMMAMGNYQVEDASGIGLRFRGGPIWLIDTDPNAFTDDMELFAAYSMQAWYDFEMVRFGAALTGRLLATEKDLTLEERTTHQLGASVIGRLGPVEPGLHFRLPIDDDLNDVLDYSLGFSLAVPIQK